MSRAGEVREILERFRLAAQRRRGQNFLCDEGLADALVATAAVGAADTVVEIGTGLGMLTRALAARAQRVVTVEVDAGLVRALRAEALLPSHVELVHADALDLDLAACIRAQNPPVRLVANLPYAVATPLLRRLLELRELLVSWSVMVQKEVALRISAGPGSRDYGSLAVLHHWTVVIERGLDLPARCFYPVPRVVSRFLHMTPRRDCPLGPRELSELERVVRGGFAHRRKLLLNSLRAARSIALPPEAFASLLARHGFGPRARAEDLSPDAWLGLARDVVAAEGGDF